MKVRRNFLFPILLILSLSISAVAEARSDNVCGDLDYVSMRFIDEAEGSGLPPNRYSGNAYLLQKGRAKAICNLIASDWVLQQCNVCWGGDVFRQDGSHFGFSIQFPAGRQEDSVVNGLANSNAAIATMIFSSTIDRKRVLADLKIKGLFPACPMADEFWRILDTTTSRVVVTYKPGNKIKPRKICSAFPDLLFVEEMIPIFTCKDGRWIKQSGQDG